MFKNNLTEVRQCVSGHTVLPDTFANLLPSFELGDSLYYKTVSVNPGFRPKKMSQTAYHLETFFFVFVGVFPFAIALSASYFDCTRADRISSTHSNVNLYWFQFSISIYIPRRICLESFVVAWRVCTISLFPSSV